MPDEKTVPTYDLRELRVFAEKAGGIPAGQRRFVRIVGGKLELSDADGEGVIFAVESSDRAVDKPPVVVEVGTAIDDRTGSPLLRQPLSEGDAFFWSSAAIEKFVLPYYLPLKGPYGIAKLMNDYRSDPSIIGILHGQYSEPTKVKAPSDPSDQFRTVKLLKTDGKEALRFNPFRVE